MFNTSAKQASQQIKEGPEKEVWLNEEGKIEIPPGNHAIDENRKTTSRILVVDDHEPFRRLVCSMLQQRPGYQVVDQAADGFQAIRKAEQLQPNLILLDIGLPGTNGLEVASRVRELAPDAKILFLTQESSPDVVREALSLGARGYVHKARAHSDLLTAIEAVLRDKRYVGSGLGFGTDAQPPHCHEEQFESN